MTKGNLQGGGVFHLTACSPSSKGVRALKARADVETVEREALLTDSLAHGLLSLPS